MIEERMLHKPTGKIVRVRTEYRQSRYDTEGPTAWHPWAEITFDDGKIYWELTDRLEKIVEKKVRKTKKKRRSTRKTKRRSKNGSR